MNKVPFEVFMENMYTTNRTFDYYIDWAKVIGNVDNIRVELSILNSVIGSENMKEELFYILDKYPEVVKTIPILIAERNKNMNILLDFSSNPWNYNHFEFEVKESYNEEEKENFYQFLDGTGIVDLLKNRKITNLIDYVTGVEVGMDTNGRKNRSGKIGENITEFFIKSITKKYNLEYLAEANDKKILKEWNIVVPVDKSSRRYDFVIKVNDKIIILENNFFSGGGSKLKSVAGEFTMLDEILKEAENVLAFVWVTDGEGWKTAAKPLEEAYSKIDYVFNNRDIVNGMLDNIILEYL